MKKPSTTQPIQPLKHDFSSKQGLYDPAFEKDNCGIGFVAHMKGIASHQIIVDANHVLQRMAHRGGCGCEANTGDGAGILTILPYLFLKRVVLDTFHRSLPAPGHVAAGLVFLPTDSAERAYCKKQFERIIQAQGQQLIGWRPVPCNAQKAGIGPTALEAKPHIEQLIIARGDIDQEAFERQLYLIRKQVTHTLRRATTLKQGKLFYVCSLSSKIIIYKGMLTANQLMDFYPDLNAPDYQSHLAMVHSRFSTNTFPSWDRAQPNRFMCHNGEINTHLGNINWMAAREGVAKSSLFGTDLAKLFPVIEPECSDSGHFDNVLEFLLMNGRSLQEAIMLMVPEAWQSDHTMSQNRRAFYEYNSALMEPWDGPASISFTDGHYIGAILDRNGLRPSRYYITHDDRVIMASEVGVLPVPPSHVKTKGRLQPGKMFLLDFSQGRLIEDDELKSTFAQKRPYRTWLNEQRITLKCLVKQYQSSAQKKSKQDDIDSTTLCSMMRAFGYSTETLHFMLIPLVTELRDPVGSMGNDTALACLSDQPRLVYDYFKQLFAQVTNPPIDSIREEVIMSLACYIGPEGNILSTSAQHAHRLLIPHPILTNTQMAALKTINFQQWRAQTLDITYTKKEGASGLLAKLNELCEQASLAIKQGFSLLVLTDKNINAKRCPISALLATGAIHQHLVRRHIRTKIGIIVETGEAREVHHHCLLIGYGADAINPYLAFSALWQQQGQGKLTRAKYPTREHIVDAYRKGVGKGILKVMAKMGISTLQSYKGAQIFEAVGLHDDVIRLCFTGTPSRIQGVGFTILGAEALHRHALGFPSQSSRNITTLPNRGEYHWRSAGEAHMWDPSAITDLQQAAMNNDPMAYQRFAKHSNTQATRQCTLRGLLTFKACQPIPLQEVEPAKAIVKRFCSGAMSFGSLSQESHEALAIAMNRIGGKSNSGEGGEDPQRFHPSANGDNKRSAIKQIASGRFGVTMHYLANADELQIKIAQGAKPGEGGELPGSKVDSVIAKLRHSTAGVGLISPPPHHDIYSIEDLAQLIHDLKNANPDARISVKLVSEMGVGTIAAGVAKAKAEHIVISGHDGGTGASPLTSIKHAGLPWELGIAETHQTLVLNNLRSRVVLQTDGQLKTGRDVAIAALLGAEEFGFSTAPLITLGCIMMRKCHLNTCPVGIATQDAELRKKFAGKPDHVINYLFMVAEECRSIMAQLGFRTMSEMVGRCDRLTINTNQLHWKGKHINLSAMLVPAQSLRPHTAMVQSLAQDHGLTKALDKQLIKQAKPALERGEKVHIKSAIINTNRTVGTLLSHAVVKRYGSDGLADDTIHITLHGSAGQSLAAWLAKGVCIELEGDANDYVGKGLSGGRLIIYPPQESTFLAKDNILLGNVALYGATAGQAFLCGAAAERFCVRNSGADAVIEAVGDHACEYMTGGHVVVLGQTGRNFAAGMSGGIAYVLDKDNTFVHRCNRQTVVLEKVFTKQDIDTLKSLIQSHALYTHSAVAKTILNNWASALSHFVKVIPSQYKKILQAQQRQRDNVQTSAAS